MDEKEKTTQEKEVDQGTAESSLFQAFDIQKCKTIYFETADDLREWRAKRVRGLIIALAIGLVLAIAAMTEMGPTGVSLVFVPYMIRHLSRGDHESAQTMVGEIIKWLIVILGAITIIYPVKKLIDELREYNRIKNYLENYEGYKSLFESEEPVKKTNNAATAQGANNSAGSRITSADIQNNENNAKKDNQAESQGSDLHSQPNSGKPGALPARTERSDTAPCSGKACGNASERNNNQGIDYDQYVALGVKCLQAAKNTDPDKSFGLYVLHNRINAAQAIAQRYPEFSRVVYHMTTTNELIANHKPSADSFNSEWNTVSEFSRKAGLSTDTEYCVLFAALTAFLYRGELPENNPATSMVDRIVNRNEEIFGESFVYLFTTALWYTNYNNFKQNILLGLYKEPVKGNGEQRPSGQQAPRQQSTTQAVKQTAKISPVPSDDGFHVQFLGEVNDNASEPSSETELDHIRAAAERGEAEAERKLGLHCFYGEDTDKDVAAGIRWLKKADADGDEDAHSFLLNLAQKNVRSFSEKNQLVETFSDRVMSDPQSARDDIESGTAYTKAYRDITKFVALPENIQRRFLLFCLKVRPEILFRKSGEVTAVFFNNELDGYLQRIPEEEANWFINAVSKVEWGRYINAERASVKKNYGLDLMDSQTNWYVVYSHFLDVEDQFERSDSC